MDDDPVSVFSITRPGTHLVLKDVEKHQKKQQSQDFFCFSCSEAIVRSCGDYGVDISYERLLRRVSSGIQKIME